MLPCLLHAQPVFVIRAAQAAANGDRDRLAQADADMGIFPLTPQDCFAVVTAGVEETTRLLENKFYYIFFTGAS